MRDKIWVLAGLLAFLALITLPIWWDLAARTTSKGPDPVLPANEKQCVAPTEYMRTSHMELLIAWREQAVRNGDRAWHAFNGKTYTISLTGTCMNCHSNKADFCDRCHNYAGVSVTCWDCHIDPKIAGAVPDLAGTVPDLSGPPRPSRVPSGLSPSARLPGDDYAHR